MNYTGTNWSRLPAGFYLVDVAFLFVHRYLYFIYPEQIKYGKLNQIKGTRNNRIHEPSEHVYIHRNAN